MCMGLCEALTVGRLGKLRECSNGMSDRVCVRIKVRACYKKKHLEPNLAFVSFRRKLLRLALLFNF